MSNYYQHQHQQQYQYYDQGGFGGTGVYGAPSQTSQSASRPAYLPPPPGIGAYGASHSQGHGYTTYQQHAPPPPPPQRSNHDVANELRRSRIKDQQSQHVAGVDENEIEISDLSPQKDDELKSNACPYQCPNCPNASFPTQKALDGHISSHITCRHDGCNYTASKGLVNAHYASEHGKFSGRGLKTVTLAVPGCRVQRFKICVGDHPDDIQAWIAERKKRFPTRERMQKRGEVEARKRAEGALSGVVGNSTGAGAKRSLETSIDNNGGQDENSQAKKKPRTDKDKEEDVGAIHGGLSTLLGGYGSSSSSDDEESVRECDKKPSSADADSRNTLSQQQQQNPFFRTRPCRFYLRTGQCRNGDTCNYLHENGEARKSSEEQRLDQRNRDKARSDARRDVERYADPGPKAPLLRKLLQSDIRRERSLTLQLLRYIVDCNYLQEKREVENGNNVDNKED